MLREKIRIINTRKLLGWGKSNLLTAGREKVMHTSKAEKNNSFTTFPWAGWCSVTARWAGLLYLEQWLEKTNIITPNVFLSLAVICWAWFHMIWNVPRICRGQLSPLCHLPLSCATPASLPGGVGWEREKVLTLCKESSLLSSKGNVFKLSITFPAQIQNVLPYQLLGRKLTILTTKPNDSCNCTLKFGESSVHVIVSLVQGRYIHAITLKWWKGFLWGVD